MIKEIITWSNSNVGFATLVLCVLTLFVSIIATAISISTARLPYKKKLLIIRGSVISADDIGYHITVTNIGNRKVMLSSIGWKIKKQVCIDKQFFHDAPITLGQGEVTTQYYQIDFFKSALARMQVNGSTKIYAYVKDTEGTEYKKYFIKASNI